MKTLIQQDLKTNIKIGVKMDKFDQRIDNIKNEFLLTEADEARGLAALAQMIGNLHTNDLPKGFSNAPLDGFGINNVYYLVPEKNNSEFDILASIWNNKQNVKYIQHLEALLTTQLNRQKNNVNALQEQLKQSNHQPSPDLEKLINDNNEKLDEIKDALSGLSIPFNSDGTLKKDITTDPNSVIKTGTVKLDGNPYTPSDAIPTLPSTPNNKPYGLVLLQVELYNAFLGKKSTQKQSYITITELLTRTLRGRATYTTKTDSAIFETNPMGAHKTIVNEIIKPLKKHPTIKYLIPDSDKKSSLISKMGKGLLNVASKGVEIN